MYQRQFIGNAPATIPFLMVVLALSLAGCASGGVSRADLGRPVPPEPLYPANTYEPSRSYSPSRDASVRHQPRHIPTSRSRRPLGVIVTNGDTLYGISQRYRVSLAELMRINNLRSPEIYTGQYLHLPRG